MSTSKTRSISTFNTDLKLKGFNVFRIDCDGNATRTYSRKDFYKICLTTGKSRIHYADRTFEAEGTPILNRRSNNIGREIKLKVYSGQLPFF